MRVFCPNCQEPVNISDDLAGKATFCPLCKAAFTAPTLFGATAPPAQASSPGAYSALPPPQTPGAPAPAEPRPRESAYTAPPTAAPPPGPPPGYSKAVGFSVSPEIVQWVAPGALVLSFLLTFFSWNGAFPGGYGVYTQGGWGALFGSFSTDPVGEKVFNLDPEKPAEGQTRLRDQVHSNLLLLLYLPILMLTAALAVLFTIYPMLSIKLPPNLEQYLPWRMGLVAAISLLLTLLLTVQMLRGFGLENALTQRARAEAKDTLPDRPTDDELKMKEIRIGSLEGALNIRQTFWVKLSFLCNLLAIAGAAIMFAVQRHGMRTWPRIEVLW